jgi:hypothetical protein
MGRINEAKATEAEQAAARQVAVLRSQRDEWRTKHDRLALLHDDLRQRHELISKLADTPLKPPGWTAPKRPSKHEAIVTAILSDCHWDEVVNPAEIGHHNAYDRHIATIRLRRWAERLVDQCTNYVNNVKVTGAVVMLGGDMLTGTLHDLAETNADHIPGSLVYWSERLAAALTLIADGLDVPVHCPVVVGNHGRLTMKPRTKGRSRDNYDWLIGHMVAAHLAADDRITFSIGDDPDAFVEVYDTTYLLTHGDQAKGGGGIGGIWPPVMRLAARKRQRYQRDFTIVMGHWHQLIMAPAQGLIVNGSTKGADEFSSHVLNAPGEDPQQAAWLTTPEHGPTLQMPIFCADRKAEGW